MNGEADPYRDWDSAYVLGILRPEDRRGYEKHLIECETCAAGVASLAGMPGILSMLTRAEALELVSVQSTAGAASSDQHLSTETHQPGLVQRLAAGNRRRRRGARARAVTLMLGVAAALTAGGFFLGSGLMPTVVPIGSNHSGESAAISRTMTSAGPATITASLRVTAKAWGTRLDWDCNYLRTDWPNGAPHYDMIVVDTSGEMTTVGSWTASGMHANQLAASTTIRTKDIKRIEIRQAGGVVPLVSTDL